MSEAAGPPLRISGAIARLAKTDSGDPRAQVRLAYAVENSGELERLVGNVAGALVHYDRYLQLAEARTTADPSNADAAQELSLVLVDLGDLSVRTGDIVAGRGHYKRSLRLLEGLIRDDAASGQIAFRAVEVHLRLRDVAREQDLGEDAARPHGRDRVGGRRGLENADPTDSEAQRGLARALG